MIWFTWRQFRTQTWVAVGALAAIGAALVVTSRSIADAYNAANVAACQGDCATAIENFLREVEGSLSGTVYDLTTPLLYLIPAVIGVFWGAPLIARELENGTHRLAWNQSVTRTRWLATKLVIVGAATAATVGLLSWAVTFWADRIDDATGVLIRPGIFAARGIVPIGYAVFAFTLGVTLGMLVRRSVPAMAATLAITVVALISMEEWIREHLVSPSHGTSPLDVSALDTLMIGDGGRMEVLGDADLPGAWVLSNQSHHSDRRGLHRTSRPALLRDRSLTAGMRGMGRLPRPAPRPHLPSRGPLLAIAVGRDRHPARRRCAARRFLFLVDPPAPDLIGCSATTSWAVRANIRRGRTRPARARVRPVPRRASGPRAFGARRWAAHPRWPSRPAEARAGWIRRRRPGRGW